MVSHHDAILNLASLLQNDNSESDELEAEGSLTPSEAELVEADMRLAAPLDWHLTVRSSGGGDDDYFVDGTVAGRVSQECRRCLTEVESEVSTTFFYPMEYRPNKKQGRFLKLVEKDDEDDIIVFGQPEVDFGPLLTQIFAIDVPLTALCSEACKGLSADGVNLNLHPELPQKEETQEAKDSPFAVLKDIDL